MLCRIPLALDSRYACCAQADGDAVMIGGAVMQVIEGLAEDFGRSSRQREEADHGSRAP